MNTSPNAHQQNPIGITHAIFSHLKKKPQIALDKISDHNLASGPSVAWKETDEDVVSGMRSGRDTESATDI